MQVGFITTFKIVKSKNHQSKTIKMSKNKQIILFIVKKVSKKCMKYVKMKIAAKVF